MLQSEGILGNFSHPKESRGVSGLQRIGTNSPPESCVVYIYFQTAMYVTTYLSLPIPSFADIHTYVFRSDAPALKVGKVGYLVKGENSLDLT